MRPRVVEFEGGKRIVRDKTDAELSEDEALALWRETAEVSRFQAKAALAAAGLLASVEAAVSGADALTQLAWAEALYFQRTSPAIATLSAGLGLTDEQVDALFAAAAVIEA